MSNSANRSYRFEGFVLDASRRRLCLGEREVELRPKSFDVLRFLLERAGRTVAKQDFFDAIWPRVAATDASLARCISDVRLALNDRAQLIVKTVPGRGYVLAVPVDAASTGTVMGEAVARPGRPAPAGPSVTVRPFANLSAEPQQAFLGAGLTEDIAAALCRFRELLVIACHTTPDDLLRPADVRVLGRELGVRYVVDGTVRRAGDRVRITAQLIDATTGSHLWAERYDRNVGDLFLIQDEITASVAGRIGPEILAAEYARVSHKAPQSLDAWECVIRALFHSSQQSDDESHKALALLDCALEHDPDYARALGMKAWILMFRAFQGWEDMGDALQRVGPLIAQAMAIDNRDLWPYLAQGMVGFATRDNVLSMAVLTRAVELSPSSVNAHGLLGIANAFGGRFEPSLACIGQAMRLSPRDTYLSDFELYQAFAYFQGARYEQALAFARQAHRLRPGHAYPLVLASACAGHLGQAELGAAMVRDLLAITPFATAAWVEATTPYVRAEDRARLVDGLMQAGLR